jgi:glycogen debranching enzyme
VTSRPASIRRGLFYRDTRFLSRWRLCLDGRTLQVLSTDDGDYFSAQFFLVPANGRIYKSANLSVIRRRYVGDGLHEDVLVLNHAQQTVQATLRLEVDADFADIFEVKDALVDLAALQFNPLILPGASLPAAGLPWFMARFGRDSLITSYQALPFVPELAQTMLRVLAARQGQQVDDCGAGSPTLISRAVVEHLMGDRLFSGWGVRTMAEGEGGPRTGHSQATSAA